MGFSWTDLVIENLERMWLIEILTLNYLSMKIKVQTSKCGITMVLEHVLFYAACTSLKVSNLATCEDVRSRTSEIFLVLLEN